MPPLPPGPPGHCPSCLLLRVLCLCGSIPRIETRTRFVILRHVTEAHRATNTGRLAALALVNSELWPYGAPAPFDEELLSRPGTWLLFPGARTSTPGERPERVVVLDGSWSQARRMAQRLPALRTMPKLSLPAPAPVRRLRQPHFREGMSTLEAVARAVAMLEGEPLAKPLDALYALLVERVLLARGESIGSGPA